jgi:hypothetical protein
MGIWNDFFGKKESSSKPSMNSTTPETSRDSKEIKERREWLFFAVLTYLRNDAFKEMKKEFSIDDITFETKYDDIYTETMVALLTIGLVNIKEKLSEDEFHDMIIYLTDLIRVFGMKLKTVELIDADHIIDVFTAYISLMDNCNETVNYFVERMSEMLSLNKDKFHHFATLKLTFVGLAYGADAFHSVSLQTIQKDNHRARQYILKSKGDFANKLVRFLDDLKQPN